MNRVSLKSIAKNISSGLTPLRSNKDFWDSPDIPWVKTEQLGEKNIYDSNEKISKLALERTGLKINPVNTLSIAMYGEGRTRGSVSILRHEMTTNQACCNITIDEEKADYEYVYYFLKTQYNQLRSLASGVRKNLNSNDIRNFEIQIPKDIETQHKIAKVLSDLDTKIELNNEINAELEAMAKLIYDYWFVQFDFPDAKGKPYKTSGGKMVWSEELKREIPEGWEVNKIEDYADFKNGKGLSKEEISEKGKYDVFGSNGVIGKTDNILFTEPVIAIGRVGAYYGEVNYSLDNCWISDNAVTSQPLIRENFWWLLLTLKGINYENIAGGSAQPLITQGQLRQLKFAIPEASIFYNYHQKVNSSYQQIHNNNKQNQKLSELRDWLLPMLMNGQVKIKASVNKVAPVITKPFKPANTYFHQTQVLGAIINASKQQGIKHGEMTLAKYSYLVDRLYDIPTSFKYDRWHLGPYPTEMKKVVNNKQFFKIQNNEVSVVPQKKEYHFQFQQQVEEAVAELASIFNQHKGKDRSHQTELLATVCKVVEDIQSTDLKAVRESMKKWPIELKGEKFKNKAEKFGEEETKLILLLISKKGWNKLIVAK